MKKVVKYSNSGVFYIVDKIIEARQEAGAGL